MDTSPVRNPTRMPAGSSSIHPGGRYTGGVHGEAVPAGAAGWLSDNQMARWDTSLAAY